MAKSIRIPLAGLALTTLALAAAAQSSNAQAAQTRDYHIESQPLPAAVNDWADQADMQVMWSAKMPGAQLEAPEVAGRFSAPVALERVLQGSGLTFAFLDEKTVAIRLASAAGQYTASPEAGGSEDQGNQGMKRSAEGAVQPSPSQGEGRGEDSKQSMRGADSAAASKAETISEVIVTGTHIRGAEPLTPTTIITRADIERAGYSQLDQVVQGLPQNFKGGSAPDVNAFSGAGQNAAFNSSLSSGINLRGLGSRATLVLLNGRRLAPTSTGNLTDISQIPLALVERIEILMDSASAIYGSDAVAGVVNIITRKDFAGFETNVTYGTVTDGRNEDYVINQLAGVAWVSGSGALNYTHHDNNGLTASDRDFARGAGASTSLLPEQRSDSFFGSVNHTFQSDLLIDSSILYTKREFAGDYVALFSGSGEATTLSSSFRLGYNFGHGWQTNLDAGYAREKDISTYTYHNFAFISKGDTRNTVWSVEPSMNGPLFDLPGGTVQAAIGYVHLDERYAAPGSPPLSSPPKRKDDAGYVELMIPIIGEPNAIHMIHRLQLGLAERYDRYSDFGGTSNPKFTLLYAPTKEVKFNIGYGTSFRAPRFSELYERTPHFAQARAVPDPTSPTGTTNSLVLTGANGDLSAEEAKGWNGGVGIALLDSKIDLYAKYFDLEYTGQIQYLLLQSATTFLAEEAALANYIIRDPTASQLAQYTADPSWLIVNQQPGGLPVNDTNTNVLADLRYQNVSQTHLAGFDFGGAYMMNIGNSTLQIKSDVTYIDRYSQRLAAASPESALVGMIYNPPRVRNVTALNWQFGGWSSSVRFNYMGPHKDVANPGCTLSSPCHVASWSTFDLNAAYSFDDEAGAALDELRAFIAITNLLDKDPPFVRDSRGFGYDPTNATALGRFVTVGIAKKW